MSSQDNRLLPPPTNLDRPLHELARPSQPAPQAYTLREQSDLRDYLNIILKRKWLILSLIVIVTTLSALYMFSAPSIYEAETTIQIEPKRQSILRSKDIVLNAPGDPAYWNTQLKLLENPELMRQVALRLDLPNNAEFLGGQKETGIVATLRRLFGRTQPSQNKAEPVVPINAEALPTGLENLTPEQIAKLEPYEGALRGGLTVEPITTTNLVTLKFRHTSPAVAQKVADTIAQVFILNDIRRETSGSQNALDTLARQIADLQLTIRQLEEQRLNYLRNNNLPLGDVKGQNLTAERVGTLSAQLLEAERTRKDLQSSHEAAQRTTDPYAVPEVQQDKAIQDLQKKIGELEEKRSALLVKYTPEWPEVKTTEAQINQLQQELEKTARGIKAALKSRYEAAIAREQKLRAAYEQERGAANQQSQSEVMLSSLNQQIETNKELYNTYVQRQKETEFVSSDRTNNITVATPSRLPRAPVGPPRGRNIAISFLLSLCAGIGLAVLLHNLDDSLRSVEDVEHYLNLPTLALIPAARQLAPRRNKPAQPLLTGGNGNNVLALASETRSPMAEAYRHLRTSLLFSSAGHPPKVILVTSAQPSEGKTTTAVNTAIMLAQTGANVLVVDCDLRRPSVHAHFGLANTSGLTNFLAGDTELVAVLQASEKLPNLSVLASGPVPPNPAELLGSNEMVKLLELLSENFTHIIIDSPPVISFTDAVILSTLVDGVMLVVHGGKSSRGVARRARQQLMDVGARIYGVVLNNVNTKSHEYSYYYNHYARYYRDDEDEAESSAAVVGR
jgi:capsular exopolysaccharide synthesis family protein